MRLQTLPIKTQTLLSRAQDKALIWVLDQDLKKMKRAVVIVIVTAIAIAQIKCRKSPFQMCGYSILSVTIGLK